MCARVCAFVDTVHGIKRITRQASNRIARKAFDIAVACVSVRGCKKAHNTKKLNFNESLTFPLECENSTFLAHHPLCFVTRYIFAYTLLRFPKLQFSYDSVSNGISICDLTEH